jgi:hypothetical protein
MDDWTPLPPPTEAQIERAAEILAKLAGDEDFEPLKRGGLTFRRDGLELLGWWDPGVVVDWAGSLAEVAVLVPDLDLDDVRPDIDHRQNVKRAKLAIKHGVERTDLAIRLMGEALAEANKPRLTRVDGGGSNR